MAPNTIPFMSSGMGDLKSWVLESFPRPSGGFSEPPIQDGCRLWIPKVDMFLLIRPGVWLQVRAKTRRNSASFIWVLEFWPARRSGIPTEPRALDGYGGPKYPNKAVSANLQCPLSLSLQPALLFWHGVFGVSILGIITVVGRYPVFGYLDL